MLFKTFLAICFLASSSGCASPDKKAFQSSQEDLSELEPQFLAIKDRLLTGFDYNDQKVPFIVDGQVVSRKGLEIEEAGDSALFTGLSLLSLSCDEAFPMLYTLISNIHTYGGMIPRHNPLDPGEERPTSRDMVLGVMVGFTDMAWRCPQYRPDIEAAWKAHYDYVKDHNGDLGPGTGNSLGPNHWLWDRVSVELGASDNATDKGIWETGLVTTATSIAHSTDPCYPIHLETWSIILADKLDSPVNKLTKQEFCYATEKLDLPLTDKVCGRITAKEWLTSGFQANVWHYRHQRCPDRGEPDGNGAEHPWVDWLVMYWLGSQP